MQGVSQSRQRKWKTRVWRKPTVFLLLLLLFLLLSGSATLAHAEDIMRGQQLYTLCGVCHGANGQGDQQRSAPAIAGLEAWYLETQLLNFRKGLRGYHAADVAALQMRPMARILRSDADVKAIAVYLASLPPVTQVTTVSGDRERGKNLYTTCSTCHGQEGQGNAEVQSPALVHQWDWYVVSQLKKFRDGLRGAHKDDAPGMQMRAMTMMLQDDQSMNDLAAYVASLRK